MNAALRVVVQAAHQKQDAGAGKTYRLATTDNDVGPPPPHLGVGEQEQETGIDNGSGVAATGLIIKLSPDQQTYDGSQLFQPQDLHLRNDTDNPFTMRVKISQVSILYPAPSASGH